ncbi:hypothetical protein KHS38_01595 [Mucilaginibacter sp. Bleaf8]|uniref:hypothetical protein n=1 Tax=Mucilaginibacter sp. Bleaf8 TaxID=2834430 RepID=UPI001BCD7607|nr:hypothetical protein [Mucilaginibacter sp. Bleaf8]MBS7563085.1 hypothetical protein [Mucilaginibacter sp. Bleaf8]
MKRLTIGLLYCIVFWQAEAQVRTDSLAYELQRKKINSMLTQRETKFDQYDQSLEERTGIFGMQTKKDIRRSNEILMDIINTDNGIFKQLKILLDYRAFEQQQVQTKVNEAQSSNRNFATTINQLRSQNEKLVDQLNETENAQGKSKNIYLIIIAVLIVTSILLLITRKRTTKA